MDNPLLEYIQKIQSIRKKPVFLYFVPNSEAINVNQVKDTCNSFKGMKPVEELDFVVYSLGGSADAAYQIIRLLRRHAKKVNLIVPGYAKSAATLFIFGADEVIMSEQGQLGPLDAQVVHPRNTRERISTLDTFTTLNSIREYTLETLDVSVRLLLSRGVELNHAIASSSKLATTMSRPLVEQLDPLTVGKHYRITQTVTEYGKRLAKIRGANVDKESQIIERLIKTYPSHEFVVDYDEAKELGVNVKLMNDEEETSFAQLTEYLHNIGAETILLFPEVSNQRTENKETGGNK